MVKAFNKRRTSLSSKNDDVKGWSDKKNQRIELVKICKEEKAYNNLLNNNDSVNLIHEGYESEDCNEPGKK